LGQSTATQIRKPRSIDGWSLDIAVHLDAAVPGFLSFLVCASTLRRQAIFAALAELAHDGPKNLAAKLRPLAFADYRPYRSLHEQIAHALMAPSRAREIVRAVYGEVPEGLLGVVHRLGDTPLPEVHLYRILFNLFARSEHRARAKALMQRSGAINATRIRIVQRLDPVLVHENVLKRLYDPSQADDANAALALIRETVSSATDDAIRQSITNLGEKTDLAKLFCRWLERMDQPPACLPIPVDDPDIAVMTSGEAITALGRRYRNCASTKIPLVALGLQSFAEWTHSPGGIAECRRLSNGDWVLTEIHALANGRVDPEVATALRRKLETFGIPALSPGSMYPRTFGITRLLGMWDFTDDFGVNDEGGDGTTPVDPELGEAADAA
jgi:hypothetical protein